MTNDACPMPRDADDQEQHAIQQMLGAKRIAVVGLSDDPGRPSHSVSAYLQSQGYRIIPVNPKCEQVLGEKCLSSLEELDAPVDVVLVFRRPEACALVAQEAVASGAGGLWLQAGIRNDGARALAAKAGIPFVQDRCMMVEHRTRS